MAPKIAEVAPEEESDWVQEKEDGETEFCKENDERRFFFSISTGKKSEDELFEAVFVSITSHFKLSSYKRVCLSVCPSVCP